LLFAMGFIVGQQIYYYIYKKEGKPEKDVETLTIFMIISTIIGARLGHVLFYEPARFLANPLEILQIWKGGLASHGASVGILTGIWIYCNYYININHKEFKIRKRKKEGQNFLYVMDRLVIVAALGGAFIRTGNFVNSEIIGKPTNTDYGVVFARDVEELFEYDQIVDEAQIVRITNPVTVENEKGYIPVKLVLTFNNEAIQQTMINQYLDHYAKRKLTVYDYATLHVYQDPNETLKYALSKNSDGAIVANISLLGIPRHPAQLYEALSSFLLFLLLLWMWTWKKEKTPEGQIFGLFLVILFTLRFFYEFMKENQVDFENDIPLNMGQWLSIPFIVAGLIIFVRAIRSSNTT